MQSISGFGWDGPHFLNFNLMIKYYIIIKLTNIILIVNKWIGRGLSCWSKIPRGLPTICEI